MTDLTVEMVHALPWRVHLRTRALVHRRELAETLARRLAAEAVDSISVRPMTGSVVVVRSAGNLDPEELRRRVAEIIDVEGGGAGAFPSDEAVPVRNARIARAVVDAAREINRRVRDALEGEADLKILLPIALATWSAIEPPIMGKLSAPPWSNLLWYAIRSFGAFNGEAISERPPPSREHRSA
jgi:hypothetical protein